MELSNELKEVIGEDSWQFYRCYKCGRIVSAMELAKGLRPALGKIAKACPCGSLRCQPAQITHADYAFPQVMEFSKSLGFTAEQHAADYREEAALAGVPAATISEVSDSIVRGFPA